MKLDERVRRDIDRRFGLGGDPDPDDIRFARVLRGLTVGALVGAAIAGSALWGRARHRTEDEDSRPD